MIAFGTAVTDDDRYAAEALRGIRRVAPDDAVVLVRRGMSLQRAYNEMLDEAAALPGIEGLVLLHQDLELHAPDFCAAVGRALAEPDVALVGLQGRRGAVGLREPGSAVIGDVRWGGPFDGPPSPEHNAVEVELADGMLLAFSPWAIRELRLDLRFEPHFHLYDRDLCFQARSRGKRILVIATDTTHHFRRAALPSRQDFVEALVLLERKWSPPPGGENVGLPPTVAGLTEGDPVLGAAGPVGATTIDPAEIEELRRRVRRIDESVTWSMLTAAGDRTYRVLGGRTSPGGRALSGVLRRVGRRRG
jgi:hypothetical protein